MQENVKQLMEIVARHQGDGTDYTLSQYIDDEDLGAIIQLFTKAIKGRSPLGVAIILSVANFIDEMALTDEEQASMMIRAKELCRSEEIMGTDKPAKKAGMPVIMNIQPNKIKS